MVFTHPSDDDPDLCQSGARMPTWGKPFNSLAKEAKRPAGSRPTRVSRAPGKRRRSQDQRTSEPAIPKYRSRKVSLEMNSGLRGYHSNNRRRIVSLSQAFERLARPRGFEPLTFAFGG
jgi:hypothetical protein